MKTISLILSLFLLLSACDAPQTTSQTKTRTFETVEGDPTGTRIYTLDNGLKVYLSQNKSEPRIQTFLTVRAGSKNDPSHCTGLAHYLEHMVFKGTHKLGTVNWDEEKKLLDKVSAQYELLRVTKDETERNKIYSEIDRLSFEAAKLACPNEYDKIISSLGASGTNAWTSLEQTVYVNNIPSTELERFLIIESERFQTLVLRLFHTELETVYEEFNRAQDNDGRKSYYALMEGLFQKHTYGTQTTLGEGEHLKNPSMVEIHKYFDKYYIPNNCALVMSGDLEFDATMDLVEKYYSSWKAGDVPEFEPPVEDPITSPRIFEKFGPDQEDIMVGYRFPGYKSKDAVRMQMVDMLLDNGTAGLINLNVNKAQLTLDAYSFQSINKDYCWHVLGGSPREGQSLDDVARILNDQLDKLKNGDFPDWLMDAVVKNMRLDKIESYEGNRARAMDAVDAFTMGVSWDDYLHRIDRLDSLTKDEIVAFVNKHYKENYVKVYKRTGEDKDALRLVKPEITPLELNRENRSAFAKALDNVPSGILEPVFVDYASELSEERLASNVPFTFIKNEENDFFYLYYILDMGKMNDRDLNLAVNYLPYLGTSKYTANELSEMFYRLGLSFNVGGGDDQVFVYLSGLEESLEEGVQLFEHILDEVVADPKAYNEMVEGIVKSRKDAKLNKGTILWSGMTNYALYGDKSPFTYVTSEKDLMDKDVNMLIDKIKSLTDYKHRIFYYGKSKDLALDVLNQHHKVNRELLNYPPRREFSRKPMNENQVLLVDYDMVQTQFLFLGKGPQYDKDLSPYTRLFNEYFGSGLSSIVFQEIRESKALAYSAFSAYSTPRKKEDPHLVYSFVGTQADKLTDAYNAMYALINNMPQAEVQFKAAKTAVKKKIASDRIIKDDVFWANESNKKLGLDKDQREEVYQKIDQITLSDLNRFFEEKIKGKPYSLLIIGKKENLDLSKIAEFAPITELKVDDLFGY